MGGGSRRSKTWGVFRTQGRGRGTAQDKRERGHEAFRGKMQMETRKQQIFQRQRKEVATNKGQPSFGDGREAEKDHSESLDDN